METYWTRKVGKWMKECQIGSIDPVLIQDALTHSSYKGMGYDVEDNERLEFLGDAVLDLLVAHKLYLDPGLSEGEMTEKRKTHVNNEQLAEIFNALGIRDLIRTANQLELSAKNKADFIEAIIGAVFLETDYEKCQEFWDFIRSKAEERVELGENELKPDGTREFKINLEGLKTLGAHKKYATFTHGEGQDYPNKNAKSALQEYCQKRGLDIPAYTEIGRSGPDHRPPFIIRATARGFINDEIETLTGMGKANSKKTAERLAALEICKKLGIHCSET